MTSTLPVPDTAGVVEPPAADPPAAHPRSRWTALYRGPATDAAWVRPSLLALLVVTAVLYIWDLGASGWSNAFYSAAVQAGSESWKAFFYGSSDAANSITVDKTPASLWIMAISVRIFGLSSWSILVPEALIGVASVGLLFATVKRWFGPVAGLLAGVVLALTPIAVLMFRFNNPDALLVLLMIGGAYATLRAVENGSTKWLVLAGTLVGFGFLTKMLQALLVVPAYALAYLIAGPPRLGKRIVQLLLSGLAIVVSAGWYIAIVELVPASMRPYIGGSQNNSLLELTLGYNGLGRLNGDETGSVGGGGNSGWGETGILRMFDTSQGNQISWLLPAALIVLAGALVLTWRAARTDVARAALIVWGTWLVGTGLIFSFMQGIFHAYYTVALAPAVGAVVGMGAVVLWRARTNPYAAATLAAAIGVTAWWSFHMLGWSPDFVPWLRWVVLILGLVAAAGMLASLLRLPAKIALFSAGGALVAVLAGPAAYAVQTVSEPHTGSIPTAGPSVQGGGGFGGGGGRGGPGGGGGPRGGGGFPGGGQGGFPGGGFPGGNQQGGTTPGQQGGTAQGGTTQGQQGGTTQGQQGGTTQGGGTQGGRQGGGGMRGGGGMGGLLDAATVSDEMKALIDANADRYTWVAAAVGSQNASGYQLATGDPVMAVGGFNGSDPSPTLEQFKQYVADGKIHYFIGGSSMGGGGTSSTGGSNYSSQISTWVSENFTSQTVDNVTLYDLTTPVQ
ncbi:ArnT family glycosyltransferase [Actinoplanes sp. NPDC051494]|uniref:ArnT family glycosyltransferase n=1 Tax=Actinoplanes sp. NPDC051494 TaxID=3363907 RepID=UPI0037B79585